MRIWFSAARYLARKALSILITIFIGVFLTLLIVSYPSDQDDKLPQSPFQGRLEKQVASILSEEINKGNIPVIASGEPDPQAVAAL